MVEAGSAKGDVMTIQCDKVLGGFFPGLNSDMAAELGLLVADVYNACDANVLSLQPQAEPGSLLAALQTNGQILGYLVANDALFSDDKHLHIVAQQVCYGVLIRDFRDACVIVIRGTRGIVEWAIDAEVKLVNEPTTPGAGCVEQGFWSVYNSMQFFRLDGTQAPDLLAAIKGEVGNKPLVVVGHSLGAAIATYMTFELADPACLGTGVSGCFLASPRPGDSGYSDAFQQRVERYVVINNSQDAVPKLPPTSLGFQTLANVLSLDATNADPGAVIRDDILCHHHVVCYAAMLSSNVLNVYGADAGVSPPAWAALLAANGDETNCIETPQQLAAMSLAGLQGG